jgi:predicted transposase YbfD/YdcC
MGLGFLDWARKVPDHRIVGMTTYPLGEILLATLVGVVCGADDWEGVETIGEAALEWLRRFLPFVNGVPKAQTFRKVFRLIDKQALAECFAAWAQSSRTCDGEAGPGGPEVVAIDGKTLRGSKAAKDGSGALHLLSAYATEAGLVLAQKAVDSKSNEITAIPDLLDGLNIEGAIVTIDAMGTQKAIAAKIVEKKADYVLALKGNQSILQENVALAFADPDLKETWAKDSHTDAGHGRVEERHCRVGETPWLAELHPEWKGLRSIVEITGVRINKKTGERTQEARLYVTSLPPDPTLIMRAVRSHWGIENAVHWVLDVTFDEDRCRTRKDDSALNLAVIRHVALNMLRADPSKGSLRKKRLRACANPEFRSALFAR